MNFPPPSQRQARAIWFALTAFAVAVVIALLAGLIWGLGHALGILSPVLWPLAVAVVVAYLLDPVVDWIERRKVPRVPGRLRSAFAAASHRWQNRCCLLSRSLRRAPARARRHLWA